MWMNSYNFPSFTYSFIYSSLLIDWFILIGNPSGSCSRLRRYRTAGARRKRPIKTRNPSRQVARTFQNWAASAVPMSYPVTLNSGKLAFSAGRNPCPIRSMSPPMEGSTSVNCCARLTTRPPIRWGKWRTNDSEIHVISMIDLDENARICFCPSRLKKKMMRWIIIIFGCHMRFHREY